MVRVGGFSGFCKRLLTWGGRLKWSLSLYIIYIQDGSIGKHTQYFFDILVKKVSIKWIFMSDMYLEVTLPLIRICFPLCHAENPCTVKSKDSQTDAVVERRIGRLSKHPKSQTSRWVNWKAGEISKSDLYWLHLTWQSSFVVISQEGVVFNFFLRGINRKSKPVIKHPQSGCEAELVSKEEEIGQQLHYVRIENQAL